MKTKVRIGIVLFAIGLGVVTSGCKSGTMPIKTLLDDPSRFDHKTVRIAGTVQEAVGLLGYGGYRVDDGTGVITVVTKSGGAPRTGAKIGVEGEFRSGFTLGTASAAVLVESRRTSP